MGIKKDAGELLLFLYQKLVNGEKFPSLEEILAVTKWVPHRLEHGINYLEDKYFIKTFKFMGNVQGIPNMTFDRITDRGIDVIEDKKEFKKQFSFGVNLGVISFSWGAIEK